MPVIRNVETLSYAEVEKAILEYGEKVCNMQTWLSYCKPSIIPIKIFFLLISISKFCTLIHCLSKIRCDE